VAGFVLRHTSSFAAALIFVAFLAFLVWAGTVVPQRVGLADLVGGNLSTMQSWIIVSGDLDATSSNSSGYRYVLTDPAVPNAVMNVFSPVEQAVGRTTISGTYTGPREPAPVGFRWIGTMHADPVLAAEVGPPWVSLALVTAAALLLVAARVSYPMFFGQKAPTAMPRAIQMQVGVRHGPLTAAGLAAEGSMFVDPGAPVRLRVAGADTQILRLDSIHTGVDVGQLRRLASSEPALRIRRPTDEMTLTFASLDQRDAAYGALLADVAQWSRARVS
jgi:hypothetical protein